MKEGYRLLGDFIQPVDERNRDLKVDYLLGVSISKQFIPSIANIVGTDLSSYKIVRTGQFAYGPVTSRNGEKISIALLQDKDCIISSSYTVFEVTDNERLDPEYLMLTSTDHRKSSLLASTVLLSMSSLRKIWKLALWLLSSV